MADAEKPQDQYDNREDESFARTGKPAKKRGGRKRGQLNKKTLERIARAEGELASSTRKKIAIDHMDDMIDILRGLVGKLMPFEKDGTKLEGKDQALWFRCIDALQSFLSMRAPYQTPRLSAIALMPAQAQQRTTVNVTILNERGDKVYSDSDNMRDDPKLIEHDSSEEEAA